MRSLASSRATRLLAIGKATCFLAVLSNLLFLGALDSLLATLELLTIRFLEDTANAVTNVNDFESVLDVLCWRSATDGDFFLIAIFHILQELGNKVEVLLLVGFRRSG